MAEKIKKSVPPSGPAMNVAKPGTSGWKSTSDNPAVWLAAADKKLKSLKGASCEFQFKIDMAGGHGFSGGKTALASPVEFRLEYPVVRMGDHPDIYKESLLVTNNQFAILADTGNNKPLPAAGVHRGPSESWESSFPHDFPRLMLDGYGSGLAPLTSYLQAIKKSGGYQVKAETQTATVAGRKVTLQRILITRNSLQLKPNGPFLMEIILDGSLAVPITVRSQTVGLEHKPLNLFWTGKWELSGQKFDDKTFTFPAPKAGE